MNRVHKEVRDCSKRDEVKGRGEVGDNLLSGSEGDFGFLCFSGLKSRATLVVSADAPLSLCPFV